MQTLKHERRATICFSGHRSYTRDAANGDEMRLAAAVEAAVADGFRIFVSGMATGFDLAAAEAVMRLRGKNQIERSESPKGADPANPLYVELQGPLLNEPALSIGESSVFFPGERSLRSGSRKLQTSPGAGEGYAEISLIAAIPFEGQADGYSPEERARYDAILAAADRIEVLAPRYSPGCYYRRDEWMVERSSCLVCWYDARRRSGGTRHTVRAAKNAGIEIVNVFQLQDTLF